MLIATRFVFVHIPRTGGSFVRTVVGSRVQLDAAAPETRTHAAYGDLPDKFKDRPAFCIVRNPWEWYVSWSAHVIERAEWKDPALWNPQKRRVWKSGFRSGRASFKETITAACEGRVKDPVYKRMRREGVDPARVDLYSAYVQTLAGRAIDEGAIEVGRFESLRPFVTDFLGRAGVPLEEDLVTQLAKAPPVLASTHRPYQDYYDDELRDLVGHHAGWLVDRFGYSFDPVAGSSRR